MHAADVLDARGNFNLRKLRQAIQSARMRTSRSEGMTPAGKSELLAIIDRRLAGELDGAAFDRALSISFADCILREDGRPALFSPRTVHAYLAFRLAEQNDSRIAFSEDASRGAEAFRDWYRVEQLAAQELVDTASKMLTLGADDRARALIERMEQRLAAWAEAALEWWPVDYADAGRRRAHLTLPEWLQAAKSRLDSRLIAGAGYAQGELV